MATILEEKRTYEPQKRTEEIRTQPPIGEERGHREAIAEQRPIRTLIGGATVEGFIAGGAVILSILGLAGLVPQVMLSIVTISLGAALMFVGVAIAARYSELLRETAKDRAQEVEFGGGAEFLAGCTGIVLGILALLGVVPATLTAVVALVFGSGLILGSGVPYRLNEWQWARSPEQEEYREAYHYVAREAVRAATGVQMLVGLGGIVLGILALLDFSPLVLSLVAMLAISSAVVLSSTAVCARMMGFLRRE